MNQTTVTVQFTSSLPKITASFESVNSAVTFVTNAVPPTLVMEVGRFFVGPKGDRGLQGEKGDQGEGLDNFSLDLEAVYLLSRG